MEPVEWWLLHSLDLAAWETWCCGCSGLSENGLLNASELSMSGLEFSFPGMCSVAFPLEGAMWSDSDSTMGFFRIPWSTLSKAESQFSCERFMLCNPLDIVKVIIISAWDTISKQYGNVLHSVTLGHCMYQEYTLACTYLHRNLHVHIHAYTIYQHHCNSLITKGLTHCNIHWTKVQYHWKLRRQDRQTAIKPCLNTRRKLLKC